MTIGGRIIFSVTVVVMLIHASLGFVDYRIPAWALFRNFDNYTYSIRDERGNMYNIRDYVPDRAYTTCDKACVFMIARWLVKSGKAPDSLQITVSAPGKEVKVYHLADGRITELYTP